MHSFRDDKDKEVTRERREDGRGGERAAVRSLGFRVQVDKG